ncbi:MAG: hypothetical protein WA949_03745, partial [Phormidesmis sp.]
MTKTVGSNSSSVNTVNRETYLKHLLTQATAAADESNLGLKALRERAIALVGEQSFPSGREEEWRFTDLSDLLTQPLQRAQQVESTAEDWQASLDLLAGGACLTTIDGHYDSTLSRETTQEGVVVAPLSQLLKSSDYAEKLAPILDKRLAQIKGGSEVFTALNTAGFADVMVVWVQADRVVDEPIYIARGSQGEIFSQVRSLIIAERHAKFTVVESFFGSNQQTDACCNNSVSELWL